MNEYTKEEDDIIKKFYVSHGSRYLEKLITTRDIMSIKNRARKLGLKKKFNYTKNEDFFTQPNTINSSIAGMLASDGHLYRKPSESGEKFYYAINLTLNNKDILYLEKVKLAMETDYKIKTYKHHYIIKSAHSDRVTEGDGVYSTFMVYKAEKYINDLLINWNIPHGAKSLILEPPKNLTELDHKLAYFCGLVSGDGSITLIKDGNYDCMNIFLIGTQSLLEWSKSVICEYFNEEIDIKVRKDKHSQTYTLKISGYRAMKLFNKIRSLDCIFLDRKWNNPKFIDCIESKRATRPDLFILDNPPPNSKLKPYKFHYVPENSKENISHP